MTAATPSGRAATEREVLALVAQAGRAPLEAVLDRVVGALQAGIPHYSGVYIYWLEGTDALRLRAFRGRPTDHVRIPVGQGICGRAAREKQTVVVDDVNTDPAYLACSLETRSEIVVPIVRGGTVFGEIDIDSDVPAAFTPGDRSFLERLAALIATRVP
jgi:L-methionine (R)-S-oxide reductase